jgi:molybdate transport system substrate-binding protein
MIRAFAIGRIIEETMKYFRLAALILVVVLAGSFSARAQTEVTLVAPGSARDALEQIIAGFETKTGYKVKATFGSGGKTKQMVIRGEAIDVSIVQPPFDDVLASGNLVPASQTPLASVALGIAVKKGMPKPDISTPEAVKRTLLAAKSITYPDPAVGGAAAVSFEAMIKKLGITEQLQPKIKLATSGPAGFENTAKGDIEFGVGFVSEMVNPGIDIAGELPTELCPPTYFVGFLSSHPKDPAAAKALLDYLASPAAAPAYRALRMKPAH